MWFHRYTFNDKDPLMNAAILLWQLLSQEPQIIHGAVEQYQSPGQIQASALSNSMADFAMQTLQCYHKSARFRGVDLLARHWRQQDKYGADNSVVIRIRFEGLSGAPYQMTVAGMAKGSSARTAVIGEDTLVPYNKHCPLEQWTDTQ